MSNLQPCTFSLLIALPDVEGHLRVEGEIEHSEEGWAVNAFPSADYRRWFTFPLHPSTQTGEIAQLIAGVVGKAA